MFSMYCFLGIINVDFMTSYALETAPSHLDCTGAVQWQATHAGVRDPASVCALLHLSGDAAHARPDCSTLAVWLYRGTGNCNGS